MLRFISISLFCAAILAAPAGGQSARAGAARRASAADPIHPIVRSDDGGMSHRVNVALVNRLDSRFNPLVTHVGIDDAELGALIDMNTDGGLAGMSRNRKGELDALTAGRFRDALRARDVRLITYRQLIEMQGLQSMRRPGGGG